VSAGTSQSASAANKPHDVAIASPLGHSPQDELQSALKTTPITFSSGGPITALSPLSNAGNTAGSIRSSSAGVQSWDASTEFQTNVSLAGSTPTNPFVNFERSLLAARRAEKEKGPSSELRQPSKHPQDHLTLTSQMTIESMLR
jgi:hypothetical protein